MRSLFPSRSLLALLLLGAGPVRLGAQSPTPPPPAAPASRVLLERASAPGLPRVGKRVLALYYSWYGTPQGSQAWRHQEGVDPARKTMRSHTHFPLHGPYDSADPAVIDRHLAQAKAAGIDTLVCSWWGRDDPTDRAIRALLARAPQFGLTVCVYWERLAREKDPPSAAAELAYLRTTFGAQPGYLREDGRPVIFLYPRASQGLAPEEWAGVLNAANGAPSTGVALLGEGQGGREAALWDGLYTLGIHYQVAGRKPAEAAQMLREVFWGPVLLARRARLISVVTVLPGYEESAAAKAPAEAAGGKTVPRQDGALYAALWEAAIRCDPDWVLISSFNQWHVGTEIEPSVELGEKYLTLTREYAARFKQPATASGSK